MLAAGASRRRGEQRPGPAPGQQAERHPDGSATAARLSASQSTTLSTWRRTRPRVLSIARSRRRRRTPVTSTWASVATASRARTPPRISGVSRTPE